VGCQGLAASGTCVLDPGRSGATWIVPGQAGGGKAFKLGYDSLQVMVDYCLDAELCFVLQLTHCKLIGICAVAR
jgi:hypothetical protein